MAGILDALASYFTRNAPDQPEPSPQVKALQEAMGPPTPAPAPKKIAPKPKPRPRPKTTLQTKLPTQTRAEMLAGQSNLTQPVVQTPPPPQAMVAEMNDQGLDLAAPPQAKGYYSTIDNTSGTEDTQQDIASNQVSNETNDSTQNQNKVVDTSKLAQLLDESQNQELEKRLNDLGIASMKEQSKGIARSEALARKFSAVHPQLDLSPLAALVDAQTGSHFSSSYKPAAQAERKAKQMFDSEATLQNLRNKFTDDQLNLLRSQIQGYRQNQILNSLVQNAGTKNSTENTNKIVDTAKQTQGGKVSVTNRPVSSGSGGKPQINNEMEKLWGAFSTQAKSEIDGLAAVGNTMALVNQNTPVSAQSAVRQILRISGDTRPSDQDVRGYARGNTELAERMNQALDAAFEGKAWSPRNQKEVKDVLRAFADLARERYVKKLNGFAQSAHTFQPTLSVPTGAVREALMQRSGFKDADLQAPPPPPPRKSVADRILENLNAKPAAKPAKKSLEQRLLENLGGKQ